MRALKLLRGAVAASFVLFSALVIGAGATAYINFTGPDGTPQRVSIPKSVPLTAPPGAPAANVVMPPSTEFEINGGALIKPSYGSDQLKISTTGYSYGSGDPTLAAFRLTCSTSHMLFDDPIVYPGQPGRSHLHTFFGNSDITGNDTETTLGYLSSHGRSTCAGGRANRSGYWIPTLIDTNTGFPIKPSANVVYYKNESEYRTSHPTAVTVPVAGLRMIAGKANSTGPQSASVAKWVCLNPNGEPQSAFYPAIPPASECHNGGELMLLVLFMQCWDGVNLDSPDHASHMAYEDFYTGCPSTHPVMLPQISFNLHWPVNEKNRPENWRLSSDRYSKLQPAGWSAHGDWINGWDLSILGRIVNNCLKGRLDCHANLLGDGYILN